MKRLRKVDDAYKEYKERDPYTALTNHGLWRLVKEGKIVSFRMGNRYMIDSQTTETKVVIKPPEKTGTILRAL